jgi:uncharacterized membrane protein
MRARGWRGRVDDPSAYWARLNLPRSRFMSLKQTPWSNLSLRTRCALLVLTALITGCDLDPSAPRPPNHLTPAFSHHDGAVTELPPLPGGFESVGNSVNDNGDVVGTTFFVDEFGAGRMVPTFWSGNGDPPVALPGGIEGEAHAINNRGDIVGREFGVHRAVIWRGASSAPQYLTPLDANFPDGEAFGVNDNGDVVGRNLFFFRQRATVWMNANTPQQLHSAIPLTSAWATIALDINNAGVAVGVRVSGNSSPSLVGGSPVIFTGASALPRGLPALPSGLGGGAAHGINDRGDVAGWSENSQGEPRAIRWRAPNFVAEDLVPLNGARDAKAFGISDQGDIVGVSGQFFALTPRATLWPANGGPPEDLGGPSVATTARGISPTSIYATGWYATSSGRVALRFRVTGGGNPGADPDGDGIANNVDTEPTVFSNAFSDVTRGGTTAGFVISRGDQLLSIVDVAGGGVRITSAANSGASAIVQVCGGVSAITITAGDDVIATCGSVILSVVAGVIEVRMVATDERVATASVPADNGLTFDPATFAVTAPPSNTAPIIVTVSNNPFTLGAGQTVQLVRDVTPPSIAVADIVVPATAPNGSTVSYVVSAADDFDPDPVVACVPSPNTVFAIGTTQVACTATDVAGNTGSATFMVTVLGARAQIENLIATLESAALVQGAHVPLIEALGRALNPPTEGLACQALDVFTRLLAAKSPLHIAAPLAAQLAADATRIKAVMSCN